MLSGFLNFQVVNKIWLIRELYSSRLQGRLPPKRKESSKLVFGSLHGCYLTTYDEPKTFFTRTLDLPKSSHALGYKQKR